MLPCKEGVAWLKEYQSLQEAWTDCKNGEWMMWFLKHIIGTESDEMKLLDGEIANLISRSKQSTGHSPVTANVLYLCAQLVREHYPVVPTKP